MVAELEELYSTDVDDLRTFIPEMPTTSDFRFGPSFAPGAAPAESFDIMLCTPRWLLDHHKKHEIVVGRHYLIVFEYNYERLRSFIAARCSECLGDTWEEVAARIGRLGYWEFEDYRE